MADIILLPGIYKTDTVSLYKKKQASNAHPQLGFVSDAHCNYKHTDICNNKNRNTMIVIGLSISFFSFFSFFCEPIWQNSV